MAKSGFGKSTLFTTKDREEARKYAVALDAIGVQQQTIQATLESLHHIAEPLIEDIVKANTVIRQILDNTVPNRPSKVKTDENRQGV